MPPPYPRRARAPPRDENEKTIEKKNQDGGNSEGSGDVFSQVLESSSENLLADDSDRLADVLAACRERGGERVDIVVDNAGKRWMKIM